MSFLMEKEITRIVDALTSMQNDRGFRTFFPLIIRCYYLKMGPG